MNCSPPGLPVHHQLLEFTQTHVHRVGDAIQPSHPLSSPSPSPNPSQHQSLFQWVNSSHEVAKVLESRPQPQPFRWTPRAGLLEDGLGGSILVSMQVFPGTCCVLDTALGIVGWSKEYKFLFLLSRVFKLFNSCTDQSEWSWLKQGPKKPCAVRVRRSLTT